MKLLGLLCLSAVATASELCIPIGQLANLGQQAEKLFNYGNEIEINEVNQFISNPKRSAIFNSSVFVLEVS